MYIQNPRGETMCILLYFSDSAFESLRRLVRWILIEFLRWIPLNPFIESLTESLHWTPLNPFIESLHWIHSLHPLLHPFIQFLWMPSSKPFIESLSLNCCKNNKTSRGRQLVLGVGLSCNDSCWQWLRCWQWQWQARHESGLPWQSSMGWPGVRLGLPTVRGHHHCHILPALAASPNVVSTGPCAAGIGSSGWWVAVMSSMLKNKLVWKNGCSKNMHVCVFLCVTSCTILRVIGRNRKEKNIQHCASPWW